MRGLVYYALKRPGFLFPLRTSGSSSSSSYDLVFGASSCYHLFSQDQEQEEEEEGSAKAKAKATTTSGNKDEEEDVAQHLWQAAAEDDYQCYDKTELKDASYHFSLRQRLLERPSEYQRVKDTISQIQKDLVDFLSSTLCAGGGQIPQISIAASNNGSEQIELEDTPRCREALCKFMEAYVRTYILYMQEEKLIGPPLLFSFFFVLFCFVCVMMTRVFL